MYITFDLIEEEIRAYNSLKEAFDHSVELDLYVDAYKLNGKEKATYEGRLCKNPETGERFWNK